MRNRRQRGFSIGPVFGTVDRLWKIRALAITLWSGVIAVGLGATTPDRHPIPGVLLVSLVLPILFWIIDATYNRWYHRFVAREEAISRFINGGGYYLPSRQHFVSFQEFMGEESCDFPVFDVGGDATFGSDRGFQRKSGIMRSVADTRPLIVFGLPLATSTILCISQFPDLSFWLLIASGLGVAALLVTAAVLAKRVNGNNMRTAHRGASDSIAFMAFCLAVVSLAISVHPLLLKRLSVPEIGGGAGYSAHICLVADTDPNTARMTCTLPLYVWNPGRREALITDYRLRVIAIRKDSNEPNEVSLVPANKQLITRKYSGVGWDDLSGDFTIASQMTYHEGEGLTPVRLLPNQVWAERVLFVSKRGDDLHAILKTIVTDEKRADARDIELAKHFGEFRLQPAAKIMTGEWVPLGEELTFRESLTQTRNDYHARVDAKVPDFDNLLNAEKRQRRRAAVERNALVLTAGSAALAIALGAWWAYSVARGRKSQ